MYRQNYVHSSDGRGARKIFEDTIISEKERIKPIVEEQLLREFVLGIDDAAGAFDIYCRAFEKDASQNMRMVILKPFGAEEQEEYAFIRDTANRYIGKGNLLLNTIIGDLILLITTTLDISVITSLTEKIRGDIKERYHYDIMAVCSRTASLSEAPDRYRRIKECTGYSFYSVGRNTLYEDDITINDGEIVLRPDYSAIEQAVISGSKKNVKKLISSFFAKLRSAMPAPAIAKTHCLELYVCITRCCSVEKIDRYMKGIVTVQKAKSLAEIQCFIEEIGVEIAAGNAQEEKEIYSSLIRDTIKIIDDNIENERLSLRWLAGTILYTNVDYLGKLFKKETGKNFSHYVMEKRMEIAKTLIYEGKMDRIYEVAEKVGYGSNSQYFSQVFKKYTGVSPLEYKEFARLTRGRKK